MKKPKPDPTYQVEQELNPGTDGQPTSGDIPAPIPAPVAKGHGIHNDAEMDRADTAGGVRAVRCPGGRLV
jgi:hypothetical protein